MSLYDKLIQQGEAKGLAEGRAKGFAEGWAKGFAEGWAKGFAEGRAAALSKVLTVKFGPLPEDIAARVRDASVEEHRDVFDIWLERVLTAESLDEVFA